VLKIGKPWFDEEFRKLLDERREEELEQLQNPIGINIDNLKDKRLAAINHFRNIKLKISETQI
jgi:hypothetical protein